VLFNVVSGCISHDSRLEEPEGMVRSWVFPGKAWVAKQLSMGANMSSYLAKLGRRYIKVVEQDHYYCCQERSKKMMF
jgi:hypothetical protein